MSDYANVSIQIPNKLLDDTKISSAQQENPDSRYHLATENSMQQFETEDKLWHSLVPNGKLSEEWWGLHAAASLCCSARI